ncbi:hypothetical protein LTR17_009615 [Elasticomyces elasticus]|nr:hypothetical protein LTR17_009615 [Elasticomyces elasticus]
MTSKGAEVHELGQVSLAREPGSVPKNDTAQSQSRGLKQDLKTSPIFFFGIVVVSTWEAYSNTAVISLSNGGPRSSIIGVFVAGVGAWCIVRSLSSMAKKEPYIGAQYRWTKMYCPAGLQPLFWSHLQGWFVTWAWIVSAAVLPFFTGSQILGIVTLFYPTYIMEGWHVYFVAVAFMIIPILANLYARSALKWIELVGGGCHLIAYVVITAVLWAAAPTNTTGFVFSQPSEVPTGWTNPTVRILLGMQATLLPLTAFDGTLHMSGEVKDPRVRVPRAMTWSYGVGWIFLITFMFTFNFHIGDPAVTGVAPPGWQLILMLQQATENAGATTFIMVLFMLTSLGAYFNTVASVSRLVWAFCTSQWWSHIYVKSLTNFRSSGSWPTIFEVPHPGARYAYGPEGQTSFD